MAYLTTRSNAPKDATPVVTGGVLISGDGWLNLNTKLRFSSEQRKRSGGALRIFGRQSDLAKDCSELRVIVGENTITVPTQLSPFAVRLTAEELLRAAGGVGEFEVRFDSPCAFVPGPQDPRRLFLAETSWDYSPNGENIIRGEEARNRCRMAGSEMQCEVENSVSAELHLPMLYFANCLRVAVNGVETGYGPVGYNEFLITKVVLPPGKASVRAQFVGSRTGNLLSGLGFLVWLGGVGFVYWRSYRAGAAGLGSRLR